MSSIVRELKLVKGPIYSHAFSQDKSILAVTSASDCLVYRIAGIEKGTTPQLIAVLKDHDKTVTAVDISIHGRILTCSQDRNAYVWEPLSDGSYRPTLVLLRIDRAASCARWAPSGYKFAVGSSARVVAVCYYEHDNNWWVSRHIRKPIRSAVHTVAWHENGILLACGGTDGVLRVFSGFVKGLDAKEAVQGSPWGDRFPFSTLILEMQIGAYLHSVAWHSASEKLACVSHDGRLTILGPQGLISSTNAPDGLPFRALCWVDDHTIVCGGYSCHPVVFQGSGNDWHFAKDIDKPRANAGPVPAFNSNDEDEQENPAFGISALRKFKEMDLKGAVTTQTQEAAHTNAIVDLRPTSSSNGRITQVSSCGLDGKVVVYAL